MQLDLLVLISLLYVGMLFLVAFAAERRARAGQTAWLRSPLIYTLSLSVYCTGWTFYGAVGFAARVGLFCWSFFTTSSLRTRLARRIHNWTWC